MRQLSVLPTCWDRHDRKRYQTSLGIYNKIGLAAAVPPGLFLSRRSRLHPVLDKNVIRSAMNDDFQCVTIHGRVFQKVTIENGIYCVPVANDELEEDRLTAQHDVLFKLFGNALFSPHMRIRDPRKILDCGYGGGDWSVQCAEEFQNCEVGLRISSNEFLLTILRLLRLTSTPCSSRTNQII